MFAQITMFLLNLIPRLIPDGSEAEDIMVFLFTPLLADIAVVQTFWYLKNCDITGLKITDPLFMDKAKAVKFAKFFALTVLVLNSIEFLLYIVKINLIFYFGISMGTVFFSLIAERYCLSLTTEFIKRIKKKRDEEKKVNPGKYKLRNILIISAFVGLIIFSVGFFFEYAASISIIIVEVFAIYLAIVFITVYVSDKVKENKDRRR
ncbi:MAG: hypothetical protein ACYDAO_03050 [Thermoplasmataceae archaeon]